jgi:predicted kinase
MKNTLIVMMAPPAVGKSTLAKQFADCHEDTIIVSRDSIRFAMLKPGDDYFKYEKEVTRRFYDQISAALKVHKYVIADATHITVGSRRKLFTNITIPKDTQIVGLWIETPVQVAIKQNSARTGLARVPEQVIRSMYKNKVSPREWEPFDGVLFISRDADMAIGKNSVSITNVLDKLKEL